ncbi:MAG: phage tail tube protein [Planctomycetota bacterium]
MALANGYGGGIVGLGEEVTYGTAVTRTKFFEITSDGLVFNEEKLRSGAIPGIYRDDDEVTQGAITVSGDISFETRYEGNWLPVKHAMGAVGTVEVASFAVVTGNKYIDFKENAGSELTATATASTYKMGERSHYEIGATNNKINFKEDAGSELTATLSTAEYATATLLAAQIKTQLEAAGAGTYTVAYSATTGKFTISVAGAATTFQFLWKTGTNGADGTDVSCHDELGFLDTLDGVDAASDTSDYSTFDPDGSLCAHLKTILEAAGEGTYTVTFSNSTKKLIIAVAGSASAVQFLWKTGTHGSDGSNDSMVALLGFTAGADGANGASDISDTAVVTLFDSTFTLENELPTGLSIEVDRDQTAFTGEGCKINTMNFSVEQGGFLMCTLGIVGEDMNDGTVTSSTVSSSAIANFIQAAAVWSSAIPVTNFEFTLNNNLKTDRRFIGARTMSEPKRNGKIEVTGSFTAEFDSTDEFIAFQAATEAAASLTMTGGTIKTGYTYAITVTFPITVIEECNPLIENEGPIMQTCNFTAYATDSTTREFNIVVRNTESSI